MSEQMKHDPEYKPSWKNRRRTIFGSLAFCAGIIFYATVWGEDTDLMGTVVTFSFILAGSVIGSYCFSAVWQDISLRK